MNTSKAVLLEELIIENPAFHHMPDGSPANWAVAEDSLRFLFRLLAPGMDTLETGAGQTTVLFAIAGTNHTCITPQNEHTGKVLDYCRAKGITCRVKFIHESSDNALPRDFLGDKLDLVLLDGAHRFPFPCVDWHYTEKRLKPGGIMVIDDYDIPSVRILHDFLAGEEEWELIRIVGRTSFFRKLRDARITLDFQGQKINQVKSNMRNFVSCQALSIKEQISHGPRSRG